MQKTKTMRFFFVFFIPFTAFHSGWRSLVVRLFHSQVGFEREDAQKDKGAPRPQARTES